MIYTVGDLHGDQDIWIRQVEPVLSAGDLLIVNGDFGIGFWNGRYWSEETFFDHIEDLEFTVAFVDGNHENFHKLNGEYPVELWNGGRVHRIRRNLLHLMRGEVYTIDGIKIFAFGGGYSFDKASRTEGVSWWPQEMPDEADYQNAEQNLKKADYQVDYIITHTAPYESVYYLSTIRRLGVKGIATEELPLTSFLDRVQKQVTYTHWYFGHFHIDTELWRNQTVQIRTIRELQTGKIVHQWNIQDF